ncbi:hypothetical protein FACS1894181_14040 [Bacteroidia bacterium]|nr:hypothetical protein FACS1894181_14040 [Bacteroidia bacterium]
MPLRVSRQRLSRQRSQLLRVPRGVCPLVYGFEQKKREEEFKEFKEFEEFKQVFFDRLAYTRKSVIFVMELIKTF